MTHSLQKLGIVAGGGELPIRIAEACRARGRPNFVLAVDEFASAVPNHLEAERVPVSKLGRAFAALRRHQCRDVVFAGKYERPGERIRFRPDLTAAWFFIRNFGPFRRSDDTLHRIMAKEFERAGFRVVSPLDADPSLAAPCGALTRRQPVNLSEADLLKALMAAKEHGHTDEGQAVVVRAGEVVAREGKAGTDAMLADLAQRGNRGGVLAKAMKPDQIRYVDPPAIGLSTISAAAAAGIDGLVIEAGATVVVDVDAVVAAADAADLFVVGVEAPTA
ncbi:MAG: DUF1009 domain-containing protein [Alphaproteobacteria bacterium]|nr:DUF1009 domain-containing protein [Alphaproteobacteria bacterium]